jgi:putative ABC transport system substrate-binding protein
VAVDGARAAANDALDGFLSSRSPASPPAWSPPSRQGLREAGFVEGRNLAIAFQWADGRYDSLPARAAELVDLPVTLIFAAGGRRPLLLSRYGSCIGSMQRPFSA